MKLPRQKYALTYLLLLLISCIPLWALLASRRKRTFPIGKSASDTVKSVDMDIFRSGNNKTRSRVYDDIFETIDLDDVLRQNTLKDRCKIYFNHLSARNPNWAVDPNKQFSLNRDAYKSYSEYLKDVNRKKYIFQSLDGVLHNYIEGRDKMLRDDQTLHDYASHVRIFNKCFLVDQKDDMAFVKEQQSVLKKKYQSLNSQAGQVSRNLFKNDLDCADIEERVFPWLTYEYPIFTRWNGETTFFPGTVDRESLSQTCFVSEYKALLNGRGIVMTISNFHVTDASRFLHLLRYLDNTYPIQVVYHEDLSKESRANLVRAARDPFRGYPKQELWFVDASQAIEDIYRKKFGGFANKFIATLFNSFEEMMFCDADAVLLKSPSFFFELKKYVDKGALFYKDRASGEMRKKDDMIFFQKLMPSEEDQAMFNVPQATSFTLGNEFFKGFFHYMESGVVLIDRKRHFIQPLMMSLLTFYTPVINRLHGDKELFWLSLSIAGDETYAFNDNFAAAIGEFTPDHERQKRPKKQKYFRSRELCSTHPAHISDADNHTLLWFNSGFRHCGNSLKNSMRWRREFGMKRRYTHLKTLQEFMIFFKAPLKIVNAVLPPFTLGDVPLFNLDDEPTISWVMTPYCQDYSWCAYSTIGGKYRENGEIKDNSMQGIIITFTPEEVEAFEAAGDVWIADLDWDL